MASHVAARRLLEGQDWVAGGLGFEPRLAESESAVLPLDDPPTGRAPVWVNSTLGPSLKDAAACASMRRGGTAWVPPSCLGPGPCRNNSCRLACRRPSGRVVA